MQHHPTGSRPSIRPNPEWFTGSVWMEPVISAPAPARVSAVIARFDPGARTAWHTHPLGQTLYVLSGKGLICRRGETPQEIFPGDTVWFAPGEEHWHGAAPDTVMSHLAIQEQDDTGSAADWMDQVTDADYQPG